jgi:hypothetical protein
LLAAGANVGARDDGGRTVLHSVASPLLFEPFEVTVVHPLIAAGGDLDAVGNDGENRSPGVGSSWLPGPSILTKAKLRTGTLQRLESTLCVVEHFTFALLCNRSNLTRCNFACGPVAHLNPFHIWCACDLKLIKFAIWDVVTVTRQSWPITSQTLS